MVLRPPKAFLCHSSSDKSYVGQVATELGRQFCLYDEYVIQTGDDLREAIKSGLDETTVFVLFASPDALSSEWVKFELGEAEHRRMRGLISRGLVLRLDPSIKIDQLPEWLRQTKVGDALSAKSAARQIRYALLDVVRHYRYSFVVGRISELALLQEALLPLDGRTPPRIVHLSGLDGIGRRTVLGEVARNLLHLNRLLVIPIEQGDSLQEIALKVADLTEAYSTQETFQAMAQDISTLSDNLAVARSVANLSGACSLGEMPVLVDVGGILNNDGQLLPPVVELLKSVHSTASTYVAVVTRRRMSTDELPGVGRVPSVAIPPMDTEDVKRLLSLLARTESLVISPRKAAEVAERVRGWPPAAYLAVQLMKYYGVDVLLADDLRIAELSLSTFRDYLRSIGLDASGKKLLRTLATHSPLPVAVLAEVVKLGVRDMAELVSRMIDRSVILVEQDGTYSASPPLKEAILREFGYFVSSEHSQVASALDTYLGQEEEGQPRLHLARVLFRALTLSGTKQASIRALALATDWIRMSIDAYHARNYEMAASLGMEATKLRPENIEARSYLIRAQIQLERWHEAEEGIRFLKQQGELKEEYFLTGFLERKRGRLTQARVAFEKAVELGRGGVSTYRELANCLFLLGDFERALEIIRRAESYRENRYVVDLKIQIATELGDEKSAREGLVRLEALETRSYFHHRKSVVESVFGDMEKAYETARLAWESDDNPPFEVLAQLVVCEIFTRRIDQAIAHLEILDRKFHYTRHDVRVGLRCRLEIERGSTEDARILWEKLQDKSKPVHQILRRDILEALIRTNPPEPKRTEYREELQKIREKITDKRRTGVDLV